MTPSVGTKVCEVDKGVTLYVVFASTTEVGMAYRPGGTCAVRANMEDFRRFFDVDKHDDH